MEKGDICFTNEIIKEVSKKLNISEKKVEYVYKEIVSYLKYLILKTDAVAIYIPYLGTLHIKLGSVIERLSSKGGLSEDNKIIWDLKKDNIEKHLDYLSENGGHVRKSRHLQKNRVNLKHYNCGKSLYEIQEIQNNR